MAKAVRINETGGPDVMRWEDVEVGDPGDGQARIRHTVVGVNFIDTYHRLGMYPLPLPSGLGKRRRPAWSRRWARASRVVRPGDRVAYAGGPPGSATPSNACCRRASWHRSRRASRTRRAAAVMLKGMTSQYLIRRTYLVKPGETVLFHAAAGGVGLIACQWLKALGATVIGTVRLR